MRTPTALLLSLGAAAISALVLVVPDWQLPVTGEQLGPDSQSMVQFTTASPWRVAAAPTTAEPAAATDGPAATASFQNVQVLTDVSAAEFMRLQTAMTAWISPKQGCGFCHSGDNFASDDNPMKNVSREMLRLTRYLNTAQKGHFGESGVTCFSCHRGEAVPPEAWFPDRPQKSDNSFRAISENWNETADTVRKFFPDNGWALYLLHDEPIIAESTTALRSNSVAPQIAVTRLYEMMMQLSDGIGANCTTCHNSRSFSDWSQSTPYRWVAYDAIRMMRDVNSNFLLHLRDELPQTRELLNQSPHAVPIAAQGPHSGFGLAVCATCHYGALKPSAGTATVANYPSLASPVNASPTHPEPATPPPPSTNAN